MNQAVDFSITVAAKDNAKKIRPIEVHDTGGKKNKKVTLTNQKTKKKLVVKVLVVVMILKMVQENLLLNTMHITTKVSFFLKRI